MSMEHLNLGRLFELLTVEEKLRGHPQLKAIHTAVVKELNAMVSLPNESEPETEPEQPESDDEETE